MKKIGILAGILLLVVVAFNAFIEHPPVEKDELTDQKGSQPSNIESSKNKLAIKNNTIDQQPSLPGKSDSRAGVIDADLLKKSEEAKKEIELLMHEFDANKANRDQRQIIKHKMDRAMEEYNKIILPIVLTEIKNHQ